MFNVLGAVKVVRVLDKTTAWQGRGMRRRWGQELGCCVINELI